MERRTFMTLVSGGLLAAPLAAEAQPAGRVYRVGVLLAAPVSAVGANVQAFRQGLRELGYVEGQNLTLELRGMTTAESRMDHLAADLVRSKTDVLVTWTTPATLAAKRATNTVPIVMVSVGDPVGAKLVASLSRPGGNVTGITSVSLELTGKQLQLLTDLRPGATRIAVLRNSTNPSAALIWRETQTAARALGVQLQLVDVRDPRELEAAFAAMGRERPPGLLVLADAMFLAERSRIAELAQKARLPTAFARSENVEAGGLVSYGPKLTEQFRQAAVYVDKILKGAKPADLPVERPTKFELVINLKTAKALGLTIPQSLLLRADEVIQ
jgi:putative ABC transport system substrate-binding protein